jgi:hypothetical protein
MQPILFGLGFKLGQISVELIFGNSCSAVELAIPRRIFALIAF